MTGRRHSSEEHSSSSQEELEAKEAEFLELEIRERERKLIVEREAHARLAAKGWIPPEPTDTHELTVTRPRWIISGYIEQGTIGLLVGKWGTAKSFVAIDWAACAAMDKLWHGRRTKQVNILYVAAEGGQGIPRRAAAWQKVNGTIDKEAVIWFTKPIPLDNPVAVKYLAEQVRKYDADFLIIDTIARNKGRLAENNEEDIGVLIDAMSLLRDARSEAATTVLGVHHHGKDASRGARGSSRLGSDVDFVHELTEDKGVFTLTTDKMKDSGKAQPFSFTLEEVEIEPATKTEEAITSCVIKASDQVLWQPKAEFTPAQVELLRLLADGEWQSVRNMASQLKKDRSTVTGLLQVLRKKFAPVVECDSADDKNGQLRKWRIRPDELERVREGVEVLGGVE